VSDLIPVAAAVIFRLDGNYVQILSAKRAAGEFLEHQWEFPGGKFEPGESAEEALHRELLEELGIELEVESQLLAESADGGWEMGNGYVLYPFLAQIAKGQQIVLGPQHSEIKWLELADAESVDWVKADLAPLRAAVARLRRL
jgi:8-oxo-dGTP diphosphatase